MDAIQNGRSFDYDMKKLLGLEKPPPPPDSELVITVSGLTGGHMWAGLVNGPNYVDINETAATSTKHAITFKGATGDAVFDRMKFDASDHTTSRTYYYSVHYRRYTSGTSWTSKKKYNTENLSTVTTGMPSITALGCNIAGNTCSISFNHLGDSITLTMSKGTLWSKGNM